MLRGVLDQRQITLSALEQAGVPPRYRSSTLENIERKDRNELFSAIKHWHESNCSYWLWIHGGFGVGKSHIAAALAHDAVERNGHASVCWFDWTRLEIAYRQRTQWSERGERDLVSAAHTVQVLIIDDFAKGGMSDWGFDSFYQLVNARYNQEKPTIFTANFRFDKITKHTGTDSAAASHSRLEEMCRPILISNKSRRVKRWSTAAR